MIRQLVLFAGVLALTGCDHIQERPLPPAPEAPPAPSRYSVEKDYSPLFRMDPAMIADAVPKEEPVTSIGNKSPYTVLGKTYELLPTAAGYREQGGASWYGLKFHGHKTSNGETYSIYEMTAAHKTLPIPSYVKVTNLSNGRTAVVRINDRGPFHEGRIIDLSYAAATKLGYIGDGTAQVLVEAIDPKTWKPERQVPPTGGVYLQVGAYTMDKVAEEVYQRLFAKYPYPVQVESGKDEYHRVKIGPIQEESIAQITRSLQSEGFPEPLRLK